VEEDNITKQILIKADLFRSVSILQGILNKYNFKIPAYTIKVMVTRGQDPVRTDNVTENRVTGQAAHLKYLVCHIITYELRKDIGN
jgi:hypothetical protein